MNDRKVIKAREIYDAQIEFVSLVDKAANKHKFIIAKADRKNNRNSFEHSAMFIKSDTDSHIVTGIVYEPMAEDSQGDYMTAEEIEKSAHWYMKNAQGVDVQHNWQQAAGVSVVESWIEKNDTTIEGVEIKAGTWLMTMEITDSSIWDSVCKGDITGFSMGGFCRYGEEKELEKSGQHYLHGIL